MAAQENRLTLHDFLEIQHREKHVNTFKELSATAVF